MATFGEKPKSDRLRGYISRVKFYALNRASMSTCNDKFRWSNLYACNDECGH